MRAETWVIANGGWCLLVAYKWASLICSIFHWLVQPLSWISLRTKSSRINSLDNFHSLLRSFVRSLSIHHHDHHSSSNPTRVTASLRRYRGASWVILSLHVHIYFSIYSLFSSYILRLHSKTVGLYRTLASLFLNVCKLFLICTILNIFRNILP